MAKGTGLWSDQRVSNWKPLSCENKEIIFSWYYYCENGIDGIFG